MIDNLKTGDTRLPLSISAPLFAKSLSPAQATPALLLCKCP
jgi:hypothetical protein